MTYEFEYLMHLFSCGARGIDPQPPSRPLDYERLMQLAGEQAVVPLVGAALCKVSDTGFPDEEKRSLLKYTRDMATMNFIRKRLTLRLLRDLDRAGIQAVLLKGYAVAETYAEPDCRVSCDTDIYVDIRDEKRALMILREQGCTIIPRSPISHHTVCEHPQIGHIELHVILYDEIVEDIWFHKMDGRQFIQEAYERHETEDGAYLALGKTDHLIFLALHMIKHFIGGGTSLRQMMDIALYFKKYNTQIDVKRFWDIIGSLKYQNLMNAILGAMVRYCGFSQDDFAGSSKAEEVAVSALLNDLESGGWLGSNEREERQGAKNRYNRTVFTKEMNIHSYWVYMLRRCTSQYIHLLFPSRTVLAIKYPYCGKSLWFVPIAWGQHLLYGFWRLVHGKLNTGIATEKGRIAGVAKERFELFKLMRMI